MGRHTDKLIPLRELFLREHADQPLAEAVASTVCDVVGYFDETVVRIESDRNLSDVGVRAGVMQAKVNAGEQLQSIRETAVQDQIGQAIEGMEAALTPSPAAVDPMTALLDQMRDAEIRRSLEGVDVVTLRGMFDSLPEDVQTALRSGPPRVVRSDSGEVKFEPLAPPLAPPSSPELQSLRDFKSGVEGLISQAEADLGTREAMILAAEAEGGGHRD